MHRRLEQLLMMQLRLDYPNELKQKQKETKTVKMDGQRVLVVVTDPLAGLSRMLLVINQSASSRY